MKLTTILFDLDGTLLPMDQDLFVKTYFGLLAKKVAPLGYDPQKLMDAIWKGTAAMVKNDGGMRNEDVFWAYFCSVFGEGAAAHKPAFDLFYKNEFQQAKSSCGFDPRARELIASLRAQGYRLVLATNPLFPAEATLSRIRWAGLNAEDFEWVTTYENSCFCKPNVRYYEEILEKRGLDPAECLMAGNDAGEDMAAAQLGMRVFLLTDCLINRTGADIAAYPHGSFEELAQYIAQQS